MLDIDYALANSANSYEALNDLVKVSKVSLSGVGFRMISIEGYEGSVRLDKVVKKFFVLDERNITYSIEECEAAVEIQRKLRDHYRASDHLVNESNNVIIVFFRVIQSCVSFFLQLVDVSLPDIIFKSTPRKNLENLPDKVSMKVLGQAEVQFGLYFDVVRV